MNTAFRRTLKKWANTPPTDDQLTPCIDGEVKSCKAYARIFADACLFPVASAPLPRDFEKIDYPQSLVDECNDQSNGGTGAVLAEWLLCFGSVLVLVTGLFRIFSSG